jgi:osmotically-inducible protein OsmY
MSHISSFLLGAIAGAGAVYVFDPESGATRRKLAMDRVRKTGTTAQDAVAGKLDLATDRAMGTIADALPDDKPENDQTLVSKIRSEVLGAAEYRAYTINVDAADGAVALRGLVDSTAHRDAIAEAVEKVTGVESVENLLHLPGEPAPNTEAARRAAKP